MVTHRLAPLYFLLLFALFACSSKESQDAQTTTAHVQDSSQTPTFLATEATAPATATTLHYRIDSTLQRTYCIVSESTMESQGNHITEEKTLCYTVQGIETQDSVARLRVRLDSFVVNVNIQPADTQLPAQKIHFTSADPNRGQDNPQVAAYFFALRHPVILTVTSRGQITVVDNLRPLVDSLMQLENARFAAMQQSGQVSAAQLDTFKLLLQRQLTEKLSSELYILPLQHLFTYYPDSVTSNQWKREYTTPLFDPVIAKNVVIFRLTKVDTAQGTANIVMQAKGTLSPLTIEDSTGTLQIAPEYRYVGKGQAVLELQSGLPIEKSYDLEILLPITITVQDSTQELIQQYHTKVKVSAVQ